MVKVGYKQIYVLKRSKDYREQEITIIKGCDEHPVCDFCKHYNFNPDRDGCYIELGYCTLHKWAAEPGFRCGDFKCKFCNEGEG